jgi:hypothetical protein
MKKIAVLLVTLILVSVALSSCATKKCPAYAKTTSVNVEKSV